MINRANNILVQKEPKNMNEFLNGRKNKRKIFLTNT